MEKNIKYFKKTNVAFKAWRCYGLISLTAYVLSATVFSCKKSLVVPAPKDQIVNTAVFDSDNSATSAMTGVYIAIMTSEQIFSGNMTVNGGLYADELTSSSNGNLFANSALTSANTEVNKDWANIYNYIYGANSVLEGVSSSSQISTPVKNQLTGEAKFMRAFCYFYLVNLFGDVPLITTTNYQVNSIIARTPSNQVYAQIIADLKDAQTLLTTDYSFSNGEKIKPNHWAATALLSRVYLYNKDWADAETQANALISPNAFSLVALNSVFLANSNEAIWQLMPVNPVYNTYEAQYFIPVNATSKVNYPLTKSFIESIEPGDQRLTDWTGTSVYNGTTYYYPHKYKLKTGASLQEYYMVLRLPELYLIRAEAEAEQGNLSTAIADINVIRARAGLTTLPVTLNSAQTLQAIAQERRVEYFCEWGQRLFDLERTNQANDILGALKPNTWLPTAVLWPIPVVQIKANGALTQNPGY